MRNTKKHIMYLFLRVMIIAVILLLLYFVIRGIINQRRNS